MKSLIFCLFALFISHVATAQLKCKIDGKDVSGKLGSAMRYGGVIYVTYKTSIGKELTMEIYQDKFPAIPFTMKFNSKNLDMGPHMTKVFYYDKPNAGDPYFATESGTMTITKYNASTNTISGTLDYTLTRVSIGKSVADKGKTINVTGTFTDLKYQ